jgi:murein DD-endopeptidase MepM/ murein hydrolase activator NlpD
MSKGTKSIRFGLTLAFLFSFYLPVCHAQEAGNFSFPAIIQLDNRDTGFKQFISDVESNRRRLRMPGRTVASTVENLTIYLYTPKEGEDIFSLAARCNVPYSAISSLNRLNNPTALVTGRPLLLPSCPGLFIPENVETDLEKIIGAARFSNPLAGEESVEIKIYRSGKQETYYFFPGADFSPTERAYFLNSGFRFPLQHFRITSRYGLRANPVTGNIVMHKGIDLAAPEGTEVFSVADGTVTDLGFDPIYGNYVLISHRDNWSSLYGHLLSINTTLRATVKAGAFIGKVGSTGQSTGPHLHFELRQDGRALNPSGRLHY